MVGLCWAVFKRYKELLILEFICFILILMNFPPQGRFEIEKVVIVLFGKTAAGLEISIIKMSGL